MKTIRNRVIDLLLAMAYKLHRGEYKATLPKEWQSLLDSVTFMKRCCYFGYEKLPLESPKDMDSAILNACSIALDTELILNRSLRLIKEQSQ